MDSFGIDSLDRLLNNLMKLPGIGRKTAQRLAVFILKSSSEYTSQLSDAINEVKQQICFCSQCFNIAEDELCRICSDTKRDQNRLCVVEDIVDIMAVESSHEYNGLYHVTGGVISPLQGIMPDDLHIRELVERVENNGIKEILLALNPSTEGDATMIYIAKILKDKDIRITRIASGVPIGSHLEFLDSATIGRAITARQDL